MLDLIIGIIVLAFAVLGMRGGSVKSLFSAGLVFVAFFWAGSVLSHLAQSNPQYNDPSYPGSPIVFLLVWSLSFIVLDLLLTILFRKAINIQILGPLDAVGGAFLGMFKGLLICGIILELIVFFPLSLHSKEAIKQSVVGGLAVNSCQLTYPYARQAAPFIKSLVKEIEQKLGKGKDEGQSVKEREKLPAENFLDKIINDKNLPQEPKEVITGLLKDKKVPPLISEEKLKELLK